MNTKRTGAGLMVLGGLIAVVGLIGLTTDRADDGATSAAQSTAEPATQVATGSGPGGVEQTDAGTDDSSAGTSQPGDTSPTTSPSTVASTTTRASAPTTAPAETTTTAVTTTASPPATLAPEDQIVAFVDEFVAWIDADDVPSLMDALHPAVASRFGADLCAAFVEGEILNLVEYRTTGPVEGPQDLVFGEETFPVYTAPVGFTYQGADFEDTAAFGIVDGEVRWFTTCR